MPKISITMGEVKVVIEGESPVVIEQYIEPTKNPPWTVKKGLTDWGMATGDTGAGWYNSMLAPLVERKLRIDECERNDALLRDQVPIGPCHYRVDQQMLREENEKRDAREFWSSESAREVEPEPATVLGEHQVQRGPHRTAKYSEGDGRAARPGQGEGISRGLRDRGY